MSIEMCAPLYTAHTRSYTENLECHSSECAHLFAYSFGRSHGLQHSNKHMCIHIHPKVVTPIMGMVFLPNRFGETGLLAAQSVSKSVTMLCDRSSAEN